MNVRVLIAAVVLILLFLPAANPLFLVGKGTVGAPFSVLCEGQTEAFVSAPDGKAERLALDGSFQAEFTPGSAGPHTVQCGNETKTINADLPEGQAQGAETVEEGGLLAMQQLLLFSIALFLALMCIAALYIAKTYLAGRAQFSKTVEGNIATLFLRADRKMEDVEISDPVGFDHKGAEMKFTLRALGAGAEWTHEYEISSPEKALPASLTARAGGKSLSMLSELHIQGSGKSGAGRIGNAKMGGITTHREDWQGGPSAGAQKRRLPKA